jgi:phage head maturation protease
VVDGAAKDLLLVVVGLEVFETDAAGDADGEEVVDIVDVESLDGKSLGFRVLEAEREVVVELFALGPTVLPATEVRRTQTTGNSILYRST